MSFGVTLGNEFELILDNLSIDFLGHMTAGNEGSESDLGVREAA